jgi:hypothetical protein
MHSHNRHATRTRQASTSTGVTEALGHTRMPDSCMLFRGVPALAGGEVVEGGMGRRMERGMAEGERSSYSPKVLSARYSTWKPAKQASAGGGGNRSGSQATTGSARRQATRDKDTPRMGKGGGVQGVRGGTAVAMGAHNGRQHNQRLTAVTRAGTAAVAVGVLLLSVSVQSKRDTRRTHDTGGTASWR